LWCARYRPRGARARDCHETRRSLSNPFFDRGPRNAKSSSLDAAQPGTRAYGPNLTLDQDTGVGSWSDAQLATAIRAGIDDEGATLCNVMPHFGNLGDTEAAAIVAYLRSLPPVAHAAPETDCGGDAGK
jgi:hypothetical protein